MTIVLFWFITSLLAGCIAMDRIQELQEPTTPLVMRFDNPADALAEIIQPAMNALDALEEQIKTNPFTEIDVTDMVNALDSLPQLNNPGLRSQMNGVIQSAKQSLIQQAEAHNQALNETDEQIKQEL